MLDPEHIFPNATSVFAQSAPGGSPEFITLLQTMPEYGLSSPSPAAHSNSSHQLLPGLLVSLPQERLQGETLPGNWDHKTVFSLLSQPAESQFSWAQKTLVSRIVPAGDADRIPLWANLNAGPLLYQTCIMKSEYLTLQACCEPASTHWKHFLKDFGKAGRLWGGLADVAFEESGVQYGYVYSVLN